MSIGTYPVQIGTIQCHIIEAASTEFSRSEVIEFLGKFLVNVSEQEIADYLDAYPTVKQKRGFSIPYIQTNEHKIVVDTGVEPTMLLQGLATLGVQPEDIDLVIISHFHPDHIGGVLDKSEQITFPKARYVVGKTEWENYQTQGGRPGLEELLASRIQVIQDNLTFVTDGDAIVKGVTAVDLPGHTLGQIGLLIEDSDAQLLVLVDAIQTVMQTQNMTWASIYDVNRELASQTRRQILIRAAKENMLTAVYHFPFPGVGRFSIENDHFTWHPLT